MTDIKFDTNTNKFFADINGQRVESPNKQYLKTKISKLTQTITANSAPQMVVDETAELLPAFSVNERFEFTASLVNMVATRVQPSLVITGEGGLGKTYTVTTTLQEAGLCDKLQALGDAEGDFNGADCGMQMYRTVKGFSTAKGLYRMLFENHDSIVVFDDCDSVLKDPVAVNILKGALDSSDERWISWNSSKLDDDLPRSFKFTGGVIFISNLAMGRIDQAIRSRSMCVDLSMTNSEKLERMGVIALSDSFMPGVASEFKKDAMDLIMANAAYAANITMRTLISIVKIRMAGSNWTKLATYTLINSAR